MAFMRYPIWGTIMQHIWERHHSGEFDAKVISAEVKLIKPDPAIYEYLLNKNGLTNSGLYFHRRLIG